MFRHGLRIGLAALALTTAAACSSATHGESASNDSDVTTDVTAPAIRRLTFRTGVVAMPTAATLKKPTADQVRIVLERTVDPGPRNQIALSSLKITAPSVHLKSGDPRSNLVDFTVTVDIKGPEVKSKDFTLHYVEGTVDVGFGLLAPDLNDRQLN